MNAISVGTAQGMFVVCFLIIAAFSSALAAPETRILWFPAPEASTGMNEKQNNILDRLKKSPATITVHIVRVQEVDFADSSAPIRIILDGHDAFEIKGWTVARENGGLHLSWSGQKKEGIVDLTVINRSISGMIYRNGRVYSVDPLGVDSSGNYLLALAQVDQTKFTDEARPK